MPLPALERRISLGGFAEARCACAQAPGEFFCGALLPFQPLLGVSESPISPRLHTRAQARAPMHTWKHTCTQPAVTMHTCVHECTQTHLEAQACTVFTHRVTHTHRRTWRSLEKASVETGPLACGTPAIPSTTKKGRGLFWTHTGAGLRLGPGSSHRQREIPDVYRGVPVPGEGP